MDFLTVETKLRFENPFIITYTVLYKLSCVEQEAITHTEDIFFPNGNLLIFKEIEINYSFHIDFSLRKRIKRLVVARGEKGAGV